jgi:hypothetical protein
MSRALVAGTDDEGGSEAGRGVSISSISFVVRVLVAIQDREVCDAPDGVESVG